MSNEAVCVNTIFFDNHFKHVLEVVEAYMDGALRFESTDDSVLILNSAVP